MKSIIYLCGGINALPDKECREWREEVKKRLKEHFDFLDPMRRDCRGKENQCYREIIFNDRADIQSADLMLALANKPSWGTAMEVFYAAAVLKKPVIVICNQKNISPWLRMHASVVFKTVNEAIDYFKEHAMASTAAKGWIEEKAERFALKCLGLIGWHSDEVKELIEDFIGKLVVEIKQKPWEVSNEPK